MQIKDYITKNLSSLNWNILPQIFAENDVELTEEIEAYLRNTPENTNWNVFDGMSGSKDSNILFNGEITLQLDTSTYTLKGVIEDLSFKSDLTLTVMWDDYKYESIVWNEDMGGYLTDPCVIKPNLNDNYCEIIGAPGTNGTHKLVIIKN